MMITSQKIKSRHNTVQGACSILLSGSHASWRFIPLTQDKFAIVDADKYDYLMKWKWSIQNRKYTYYAIRNEGKRPNRRKIFMHNQIMDCPQGLEIDHKNHKGYDNRVRNLRYGTHSQNCQNRKYINNKYKGVTKAGNKWISRIQCNGQRLYLGRFDNEIRAAKVYDKKAKELFGEYACTNF